MYGSGGLAESVSDDEIVAAQKDLARLEGIGVEPASASSIAGLYKLVAMGVVRSDETVVCITTGHLLKDPEEVLQICDRPVEVDATMESVREAVRQTCFGLIIPQHMERYVLLAPRYRRRFACFQVCRTASRRAVFS